MTRLLDICEKPTCIECINGFGYCARIKRKRFGQTAMSLLKKRPELHRPKTREKGANNEP